MGNINNKKMNDLTVKEKIFQMFIMGFSGTDLNPENKNIQKCDKKRTRGSYIVC